MRVSENTSASSVGEALRRTRGHMEKLQIQNATQKKLLNPSDDPAGMAKILDIRTQTTINSQFESNGAMAKHRLEVTDGALSEMYELFLRAKEIAIAQSSEASASVDSRLGVAQEVSSLYNQLVSIGNRRVGEHYLFSGFKTLTPAYSNDGEYKGDQGEIPIEIQKGVFTAMNIPGPDVFEIKRYAPKDRGRQLAEVDKTSASPEEKTAMPAEVINAFRELDALRVGLLTNDTITVRDRMEHFDEVMSNIVTTRAKLSSRVSGIDAALASSQRVDAQNAELSTQLEDADYAELWSNLAKEESVLRSSLHAAQKLIQPTLLEFLR